MIPVSYKEFFLAKLTGEVVELPPPVEREEMYLYILCGEDAEIPTPTTVDEMYLAALCGMDIELPRPVTRLQIIWHYILQKAENDMKPATREEAYWLLYAKGEIDPTSDTDVVDVGHVDYMILKS